MNQAISDIIAKQDADITEQELSDLCGYFLEHHDDLTPAEWVQGILRVSPVIQSKLGFVESVRFRKNAYKELDHHYMSNYGLKADVIKQALMEYIHRKDIESAHKMMDQYLYNKLAQIQFRSTNHKMRYYSFRSFSKYSLDDIRNETVSLAHPREFNDPLDTLLVRWLESSIGREGLSDEKRAYLTLMKKVSEHIKLRCLIGKVFKDEDGQTHTREVEDLNVLMWSHYADSHKGFCVEYEFERELFEPKPGKLLLIEKIDYKDQIDLPDEPTMHTALFEKSNFWEYENEMRMCQFDTTISDKEYPVVECKKAIKAVYLGVKCSDKDQRDMEKAIGNKDIPLYKMSIDEKKLTRLKKTQIA